MQLGSDKAIAKLIEQLGTGSIEPLKLAGSWGSFAPLLVTFISKQIKRPICYVRPHQEDCDKAMDDLHSFGAKSVEPFYADLNDEKFHDASDEIACSRLKLLSQLAAGNKVTKALNQLIITASVQSLCQPVPTLEMVAKSRLKLAAGRDNKFENVTQWLIENGFESVDKIDMPGQFAHRGGIIDIYAPLIDDQSWLEKGSVTKSHLFENQPVRIEFFGDTVETIRQIDLDNYRSTAKMQSINVISTVTNQTKSDQELFLNLLPKNTLIIFEQITDCQQVAEISLDRLQNKENFYDWTKIYQASCAFQQLHISRFADELADGDNVFEVEINSLERFQEKSLSLWKEHKKTLQNLIEQAKRGTNVYFYCQNQAQIKRVSEIITQSQKLPNKFKLLDGFVNSGFGIESINAIVVSHHEVFGQYAVRRNTGSIKRNSITIESLDDLKAGDYVVHVTYGIGKFIGTNIADEDGLKKEYLAIEYADKVKIYVSAMNISLVQKYIGSGHTRPKLSKIGAKQWRNQKEKAARSIEDLANQLLKVQAKRQAIGGFQCKADTHWQIEFDQSFCYQETLDQLQSIDEVKRDMQSDVAMDRLICGDVGYGKTEIAMRAAFKAVENGKQVAMLVPTTVLAVQHGRTFAERFADFPVNIEVLNRFKTKKQAKEIVSRLACGKVDILVGTHRILSKDVEFSDLGLLIVDEEQRFGVVHKEKLKSLRADIDVLTMTATPIPRTLHMAMISLRDISSLQTAPLERRSVETSVVKYSDGLIKKAVARELNRQGQIFFLHNRVLSIERRAIELERILKGTGVKIAVGHGQMSKRRLENVMIDFVNGDIDLLLSTTIIESGLDIPNANTIIIDDADKFGLAQLHQLRGRVGRYKHRAYAYMLLPKSRTIRPIAVKRLKAIEEYSHLGDGFKIALRDLEIRGAGNILGPQQSGHIGAVGYQMYCQMLSDAVNRLKGLKVEKAGRAIVDLNVACHIPKNYIAIDRHRMEIYRKITTATNDDDLKQIKTQLRDVYGKVPEQVEMLLDIASVKIMAAKLGIKSIILAEGNLMFDFQKDSSKNIHDIFAGIKGKITVPNPQKVYLRLDEKYFEPMTMLAVLRKILSTKRNSSL